MLRFCSALVLAALVFAAPLVRAQTLPPTRAFEPVIVTGEDLAPLAGATPERVAAFRYEPSDGSWAPIPVQVDERELVDIAWVYNGRDNVRCETEDWCFPYPPFYYTLYTDPDTFLGPDSDPFVDADDEVVFMAQDAGPPAPTGAQAPEGVLGAEAVQVRLKDAATDDNAYVYLFWQDGRYPQDAGRPYVTYTFDLLSGDYASTYKIRGVPYDNTVPAGDALGANPEDSVVETAYYRRHYGDRWIEDGLQITAGDATGVDLLDRWKIQYQPGDCRRTEYTASAARGAIVANRSGAVRGVRSVIGFNSGPLMQQDAFFYERYAHFVYSFRSHPVGGAVAYTDFSTAAEGMMRYSNVDPEGFKVDGEPDPAGSGRLQWEIRQGPQGTYASAYALDTDINGLRQRSYYADEAPAQAIQCTGDAAAIGASGILISDRIPNTDPGQSANYSTFVYHRHELYEAPSYPLADAASFVAHVGAPLELLASATPVNLDGPPPPPPGGDPDLDDVVVLTSPRPSPVLGNSRVTYWLGDETEIVVSVFDVLGRRVRTLDEGTRSAGYHDVALAGDGLATGIYVLRIDTPQGGRSVTFYRR